MLHNLVKALLLSMQNQTFNYESLILCHLQKVCCPRIQSLLAQIPGTNEKKVQVIVEYICLFFFLDSREVITDMHMHVHVCAFE